MGCPNQFMPVTLVRNITNADQLNSFSNRKICDVEEFSIDTLYGKAKAWKGSTEEEYFSLLFVNGMLTLCISEREMFLGTVAIAVAMTKKLKEAVEVSKVDELVGLQMTQTYTDSGEMNEDIKKITLKDCMKVLRWKLKPNAKIFFDNFLTGY